jgi:hypothetical protein
MLNFDLNNLKKIKIKTIPYIFRCSHARISNIASLYEIRLNRHIAQEHCFSTLGHELGHILYNKYWLEGLKIIRAELVAWRFAKTIIPVGLFNEQRAWYCLEKYIQTYIGSEDLIKKLKSIGLRPLNIEYDKVRLIRKFLYSRIKRIKIFKPLIKNFSLNENLIGESRLNKSNF